MCRLCQRADGDPEVFGQTCQQDGLCIHENCLVSTQGVQPPAPDPVPAAAHPAHTPGSLLQYHASGLSQRGADGEGFFGFLFPDIHQELQRVAQKVRRGGRVPTSVPVPQGWDAPAAGCKQLTTALFVQKKVSFPQNLSILRTLKGVTG